MVTQEEIDISFADVVILVIHKTEPGEKINLIRVFPSEVRRTINLNWDYFPIKFFLAADMGISVINLQSKSSFRFHQFCQNNDEFSIFIKTLHSVKSCKMINRKGGKDSPNLDVLVLQMTCDMCEGISGALRS